MADAGEHQQLGGADEAGGQDDLLAGAYDATGAVLVGHLDTGRPAVLDDDLGRQHLALELERGWEHQGEVVEVAAGRAVAQAVRGVLLHPADALLRLTVVVVEDLHAQRVRGRLDELEGALLRRLVAGDPDRATGTAEGVGAVLEVLHALVRRVDRVGVPTCIALGGPGVVVGAVAADVDHAVDRAGATDHLAARHRHLAVQDVLLRRRVVAPVDALLDLRHRVHRADHAGLLDQELFVALARLEHDHARARLRETASDRGARAAGSDHHVVGLVPVRRLLGHAHLVVDSFWAYRQNVPRATTITCSSLAD